MSFASMSSNLITKNNFFEIMRTIRDLGILFDYKLSCKDHILDITFKAYKMLGLGTCPRFSMLKLRYTTLIKLKLEYASVVCCPNYVTILIV